MRITFGKVTDIDDPAQAGRIQCDLAESDGVYPEWINPVFLGSWHWMPNVDDTVLVLMPPPEDLTEFSEEVYYLGVVLTQETLVNAELRTENYSRRRGTTTKGGHFIMVDDTKTAPEITIAHEGKMLFSLTKDGMFFGTQEADEPFVMGAAWKTMMETLIQGLIDHTHPSGSGPTGPPLAPEGLPPGIWKTLKDGLDDQLSKFIFGQEDKPT